MVYEISVNQIYNKQFVRLMGAMKKMRMIKSIQPKNSLTSPGHTSTNDELLQAILSSKEQIKNGNYQMLEKVQKIVESRKK